MELIAISDKVIINPDKISSIEFKNTDNSTSITMTVDGRTFDVSVNVVELLKSLKHLDSAILKQFVTL